MSTVLRCALRSSVRTLALPKKCCKSQVRWLGRGYRYPYKSAKEAIETLGKNESTAPGTSTYGYREYGGLVKSYDITSGPGIVMFILWFWVLYNTMSDFEHLLGHYRPPTTKEMEAWTDQELGIPPDNED